MKFSCTRDNLYRGLSITSRVGGKNVNLPILANVLMKAEGGALKLTATNLEMAISCLVRGKIEQEGEFTVPSKLFFDFVSLLPEGPVDLEVKGDTLHIKCGSHSTRVSGLSASEFPLVPGVTGGVEFSVVADGLRKALTRVLFAAATNESRPELAGVNIQFNEPTEGAGKVILAATDSYRLSEAVIACKGSAEFRSAIVPSRALAEVGRILSVFKDGVEIPDSIEFVLTENQVVVRYGSVELTSRTIEGTYPNYRQIIPNRFETQARVQTDSLARAIKAASLFARTGLFDVQMEIDPTNKWLRVTGTDAARGENSSTCDVDLTGTANRVTLNYRYVLDGLMAMDTPETLFQMIDADNPCVLVPGGADSTTDRFVYIVMPIKA